MPKRPVLPPRLKTKKSDLHPQRPRKDLPLPPGHSRTRYAGTTKPKK